MDRNKEKKPTDEKYDQQITLEQELFRLSRTYKLLERNRSTICEKGALSRQRRVLGIFKKEENNLTTELGVATSDVQKKRNRRISLTLNQLLHEFDSYDEQLKIKKNYLKELEGQIKRIKKEEIELQSKQTTDVQHQQRVFHSEKVVEALENNLETQMKKFCTISYQNKQLKEQIDHLLVERIKFNKIWDKLIKNLNTGKKFMLDLIEQATIAYDQREEWVSKLNFLRHKAKKDLEAHITEMKQLERKQYNEVKLEEFFKIKGQKRMMKELERKEIEKQKIRRQKLEEDMTKYQQLLNNIREFTGEDDIGVIIQKYLAQEVENFAIFRYVNDVHKEMEKLTEILAGHQLKIDECVVQNKIRLEEQDFILKDCAKKLDETKKSVENSENTLKQVNTKLDKIMVAIEKLFKLCKCNKDPLLALLGDNTSINQYNLLLYLNIIESNIQEYMVMVYKNEAALLEKKKIRPEQMLIKDEIRMLKIYNLEQIGVKDPCPLCVEHEQVSDVIDDLQKAWNKEMTTQKLKEELDSPEGTNTLHNVSACHLPKSREILQRRYQ